MDSLKSQFLGFDKLAAVLGVSVKKLRAGVDIATGVIHLGGTAPPIQTLKLGHRRVVGDAVLAQWLEDVGAVRTERERSTPLVQPQSDDVRKQRARGRPRKLMAGDRS